MLFVIVALSLHNGAIIGHLMGRYSNEISLRPDHAKAINGTVLRSSSALWTIFSFSILPLGNHA